MASLYGEAIYGIDTYNSNNIQLKELNTIYLGSEIVDGYETDAIFDEIQIFTKDLSDDEINNIFTSTVASTWTANTLLLSHLDNSINAGNLNVGLNIIKWNFYRKLSSESQYTLIATIDNTADSFYYDYMVANNTDYDYAIEGVGDNDSRTIKYTVRNVSVNFNGFWLVDNQTNTAFQFLYNIPSVNMQIDEDRQEIKTFSKYPIVKRGKYKIHKGSLTTTIDEDDNIFDKINILENMEGKQLLLKFYSGQLFFIDIYNISSTLQSDEEYMTCEVKCDWSEVGVA